MLLPIRSANTYTTAVPVENAAQLNRRPAAPAVRHIDGRVGTARTCLTFAAALKPRNKGVQISANPAIQAKMPKSPNRSEANGSTVIKSTTNNNDPPKPNA